MPKKDSTLATCDEVITLVEQCFNKINKPRVTKDLQWEWDEKHQVLLTHFAKNFSEGIYQVLEQNFADYWHNKQIKNAPNTLKQQLLNYGKLNKHQAIFTQTNSANNAAIIAVWWPWGHGNTFSLRLGMLDQPYQLAPENISFWQAFKNKVTS